MSMMDLILKMPRWYFLIMILFSLFYAARGVISAIKYHAKAEDGRAYNLVYWYIQEILFKIIVTMSGFCSLLIANHIFSSVKSINEIGSGAAILLIFCIIWGVTGITGYLTLLIATGKVPGGK
jgi:hypothetical protein